MFHCYDCDGQGCVWAGWGSGYYPWDVEDIWEPCKVCHGKGKTWKFWRFRWWMIKAFIRDKFDRTPIYEEEDIPF